jgi:hypothetical protein
MSAEGQLYFALSRAPSMEALQVGDCPKRRSQPVIQAGALLVLLVMILHSCAYPTCHSPCLHALKKMKLPGQCMPACGEGEAAGKKAFSCMCMQTSAVAQRFYASLEAGQAYTNEDWCRWQEVHPAAC